MIPSAWLLARALVRVARATGQEDAVGDDLARLAGLIRATPDVLRLANHPRIPIADKQRLLSPAARTDIVRGVLGRLVRSRDLALLPDVNAQYRVLLARARGFASVEVRSAAPLSPGQEREVGAAVESFSGLRPALRAGVDPGLIGGVRVRIDGKVADLSLRQALDAIRERLLAQ
jgi:F-type H+-transporting ATPase subunit delta